MRIIVSSQALTPWYGGSAFSEASLCAHLSKYADVSVLCRQGAVDYSFVKSFGVTGVREFQPSDAFDAWKSDGHWLSQLLGAADVFHLNGHWKWENYFLARLCHKKGIPYILHPRGMLLVGHRKIAMKRLFNIAMGNWIVRHAAKVIALSRFEVAQFAPYRIRSERIVVLPNGITMPRSSDARLSATDAEASYFLYFGRLEARKNLLFLVDAFSQYRREGGRSELLMIGPAERDYDKKIEARVRLMGLQKQTRILSPVYGEEKWEYLRRAHAVIYPTIDEPFGRVSFEAIASGSLPIIPDESGSAEYLHALLPDCIYQHQNTASLVSVMHEIERQRALAGQVSMVRARDWVRDELNWEKIARSVVTLYEETLRKEPKRAAHAG